MYVGTLYLGWNDVPQCVLDLADGEDVVYDIFLGGCPPDMSGTPDLHVFNPVATMIPYPTYSIGRPIWSPDPSACANCLPIVCLRYSAGGVFLGRCTICPELCDLPCSGSLSSSSGSSGSVESSGSSASSGSSGSESSGSESSSSGGGSGSAGSSSSSESSESESSGSISSGSESGSGSGGSGSGSSSESSSSGSSSSSEGCTCQVFLDGGWAVEPDNEVHGSVTMFSECDCEDGTLTITDTLGSTPVVITGVASVSLTPYTLIGNYADHVGEFITVMVTWEGCGFSCQGEVTFEIAD